jgi:hypothetical protein
LFVKDRPHSTIPLWSEFSTLPFVRFQVKQNQPKNPPAKAKLSDENGAEQACVMVARE